MSKKVVVIIGGERVQNTPALKRVTNLMNEHHTACEKTGKKLRVLISTKKVVASYAHLRKHKVQDLAEYLGICRASLYSWMSDLEAGIYNKPANTCCVQRLN